ncbi:hypothetical protein IV203_032917 [Nitzschia inconspicua]|uniref:Uncharacterized protein n=1 Tax=Nitzschia inconspicua TaxID=303405 RepID=A0A9K3PFX6_9STRA|nr:hypothetical protein IV203_032917 [Nitzschia inconspicua]
MIVVLKMEQCHQNKPIGKAGFSEDINKKIQSDHKNCENNSNSSQSFFGTEWQVPVLDGVHFRQDHDNDTPCLRGFPSRDREGTLRTWTWTGHPFIATRPGLVNYENDNLIRQLHSKCVSICMEADKSPSRQKAFNDHSINTIISAMWEGPDYTKFYNDIGEEEASFFFSRHQNGRYSDMAVKEFGFPNDTILTTGASHPDLTSNNVTNHALLISNASYTDGTQSKRPAGILPFPKKRARILGHETPSLS